MYQRGNKIHNTVKSYREDLSIFNGSECQKKGEAEEHSSTFLREVYLFFV